MARLRSMLQETLIYFGLAEPAGEAKAPRTVGQDVVTVVLALVLIGGGVWNDRGPTIGLLEFALFVPVLALAAAGRMRGLDDRRLVELEDTLAIPPIFIGGVLLLVPNHLGVRLPVAIASVLVVGFCAASVRRLARSRRTPAA